MPNFSSVSCTQMNIYKCSKIWKNRIDKNKNKHKYKKLHVPNENQYKCINSHYSHHPTQMYKATCAKWRSIQVYQFLLLTSSNTNLGSNALLIRQPRTGVVGICEFAIFSRALNMKLSLKRAEYTNYSG